MKKPIMIDLKHIVIVGLIVGVYMGLTNHGANVSEDKRQARIARHTEATKIVYQMDQQESKDKRKAFFAALTDLSGETALMYARAKLGLD